MMEDEGFEQVNARHHDIAEYTRGKVKGLGLKLLAVGNEASDTVTSVVVPEGVDAAELLKVLNTEYDTVLAAGQGKLTGKIFRIGHMGIVDKADIDAASRRTGRGAGAPGLQEARNRLTLRTGTHAPRPGHGPHRRGRPRHPSRGSGRRRAPWPDAGRATRGYSRL